MPGKNDDSFQNKYDVISWVIFANIEWKEILKK